MDATPATYLRSVKLAHNRRVTCSEPFVIKFRGELESRTRLKIELEFMAGYLCRRWPQCMHPHR